MEVLVLPKPLLAHIPHLLKGLSAICIYTLQ